MSGVPSTSPASPVMAARLEKSGLGAISEKVAAAEPLDYDDGLKLFACGDVIAIGALANVVRERMNGNRTYYVVNRHINYSNVCAFRCSICAFSRDRSAADAYEWDVDEVVRRAAEAVEGGARELHVVGGVHPSLPLGYYTGMLEALRRRFPHVDIKAFTAVEVRQMALRAGRPVGEILAQLKRAGLTAMPGGGAEIFEPRVRRLICDDKISGEEWLDVMRTAHKLGIRSNATMLYGHLEDDDARVRHLLALRELQDETGGFLCFIPLAFHPHNTRLGGTSETPAHLDLKVIAISRLLLHNFGHVKAYWAMIGLKLAQVAQSFGADDLDGTILDERITHAAGAKTPAGVTREVLELLIRGAGREPVERDGTYNAA